MGMSEGFAEECGIPMLIEHESASGDGLSEVERVCC